MLPGLTSWHAHVEACRGASCGTYMRSVCAVSFRATHLSRARRSPVSPTRARPGWRWGGEVKRQRVRRVGARMGFSVDPGQTAASRVAASAPPHSSRTLPSRLLPTRTSSACVSPALWRILCIPPRPGSATRTHIPADLDGEVPPDGPWLRVQGVGGADDLARRGHHPVALPHLLAPRIGPGSVFEGGSAGGAPGEDPCPGQSSPLPTADQAWKHEASPQHHAHPPTMHTTGPDTM